jgi:16S rRNA (cytosine967-C5)-methyltransferase
LSKYHSYFNKAVSFLELYQGKQPFALFLKEQFALNKQMGSRDRRAVRQYCYSYFRLGKALPNASIGDRLLAGVWLTSKEKDPLLELYRNHWNEKVEWAVSEKLNELNIKAEDIFPFSNQLSSALRNSKWSLSLLEQPAIFIRIRPGKEKQLVDRSKKWALNSQQLTPSSISFPATTQLQNLEGLNRDYVIQDNSSQQIAQLFTHLNQAGIHTAWDCCAASGGKSILIIDHLPKVNLLATDVRNSMMPQLRNRLQQAGLPHCKTGVVDLEQPILKQLHESIDLLIADVPCSGSGTWSRTPEQLCFFELPQIESYAVRQRKILTNALVSLRKGGYLLYITCSVFEQENEKNVEWLVQEKKLRLIQSSIFDGSTKHADTLFAALLQQV